MHDFIQMRCDFLITNPKDRRFSFGFFFFEKLIAPEEVLAPSAVVFCRPRYEESSSHVILLSIQCFYVTISSASV